MAITASDIKSLREATGAGMMDCKKALTEASGDFEAAKRILREKGLADVGKRAGRTAAEGLVDGTLAPDAKMGVLIEVNCETDFVAKGERFHKLAAEITRKVYDFGTGGEVEGELRAEIEQLVEFAAVDLREKLGFARGVCFETRDPHAVVDVYLHKAGGWAKKGVLVEITAEGVDKDTLQNLAHELALHIQFHRPQSLTRNEIPEAAIENERQIAETKARNEGKPDHIVPRIVEGAVAKYYKDRVLLEQPFIREEKKTVQQWLADETGGKGRIVRYARYEIGEVAVEDTAAAAVEID